MTFKATIREIENGFLVEHSGSKLFDYSEIHVSTFDHAILLVIAKHAESHPQEAQKGPSRGAIDFCKVCGLIAKDFLGFKEAFQKSFPGEYFLIALELARCQLVDGKVVFVGG